MSKCEKLTTSRTNKKNQFQLSTTNTSSYFTRHMGSIKIGTAASSRVSEFSKIIHPFGWKAVSDEATETPPLTDLENESMRFCKNVRWEAARESVWAQNAMTYIIFLSFASIDLVFSSSLWFLFAAAISQRLFSSCATHLQWTRKRIQSTKKQTKTEWKMRTNHCAMQPQQQHQRREKKKARLIKLEFHKSAH